MQNKSALRARAVELANELDAATAAHQDGRLESRRYKGLVERIYRESQDVTNELKAYEQAARFSFGTEVEHTLPEVPGTVPEGAIVPASPMDATPAQVQQLLAAAQARTPFSFEIQPKSLQSALRTKAAASVSGLAGGFTGNLPPVQSPYAVGLGYEPTRIADLFPGAQMPGPSATWLSHTSNTGATANVAEAGTKPDLGPVITEYQVKPTKIAGLVSMTLEAWQDTERYGEGSFAAFLPQELTRDLVNVESNLLLNANTSGGPTASFNGLLATSGTLTRAMGSDSPLDCLAKAYVDLRVGSAYADPDLLIMHPSTLGALRRVKDTQGRYVLDLLNGPLTLTADGGPRVIGPAAEPNPYSVIPQGTPGTSGTLWGAPIATTTQCAAGTALVLSIRAGAAIFWQRLGLRLEFNMWGDTMWSTNTYTFRAEERIALSVPRPSAINIVTGLPTS